MIALCQECEGKQKSTGIAVSAIFPDLHHAEHSQRKQQHIQAVRVTGTDHMRLESSRIDSQKCHCQKRFQLTVAFCKQTDADRQKHIGKCRIKPECKYGIAEDCHSQHNAVHTERRF